MFYRSLADLVLLLHFGFVAFVALGGLLVWRWPRWAWLHVPAALWGVFVAYTGSTCPLTPLESAWRHRGGEVGYPGGFLEHYVTAILYPIGLTRGLSMRRSSGASAGKRLPPQGTLADRRRAGAAATDEFSIRGSPRGAV
jgi:hypothetical protein